MYVGTGLRARPQKVALRVTMTESELRELWVLKGRVFDRRISPLACFLIIK